MLVANTTVPILSEEALSILGDFKESIVGRIHAGHSPRQIAQFVADEADVTPGQVVLYMQALAQLSDDTGE